MPPPAQCWTQVYAIYQASSVMRPGPLSSLLWPCEAQRAAVLEQHRRQRSPSRLVTGAKPRAVVAMEILVERNEITPVWICLEVVIATEHWPQPIVFAQADRDQPLRQVVGDRLQAHHLPGASRMLDRHGVAVELRIGGQRLNEQKVHRKPDRSAPVGVAAEHAVLRLSRHVLDGVGLIAHVKGVGIVEPRARDRADAMRREKLLRIEHAPQHPPQPLAVHDAIERVVTGALLLPRAKRGAQER